MRDDSRASTSRVGLHRSRLSPAASWKKQGPRQSDNGKKKIVDFTEGSSVSPRWRWPSWSKDSDEKQNAAPKAPRPPPSFKDSAFDFWPGSKVEEQSDRRPESSNWNFGDFSIKGKSPGVNDLASRLYRNKEIRDLAEQEATRRARAEEKDPSLASASRPTAPPGGSQQEGNKGKGQGRRSMSEAPQEFESDAQFYKWMEGRRLARSREREERQEDEIWGIARAYLVVAVVIILAALTTTLFAK